MGDKRAIARLGNVEPRRTRSDRRTSRACDRCRIRKSKCDGKTPCGLCANYNAVCVYAARRTRDDRNHLLRTREVLEEGLHRLYEATVEHQCFPGDLSQAGNEVSTKEILEALQLSVPSRDETAHPPLPSASGNRRHSLSLSPQGSCGRSFHPPSPGSTISDLSYRHSTNTSPTKTLHPKISRSSVSAPRIQSYWSSPSTDGAQSTVSPASCPSRDANSFKALSSPSPVTKGDMCAQFIMATSYPPPTAAQYSSLAYKTFPPYDASDIFDFEHYNQDAAISLLVSQQQPQDYPLNGMPDQQINPGFGLAHSDQMPMHTAHLANQLAADAVNSSQLKDETATEMLAFGAQQ